MHQDDLPAAWWSQLCLPEVETNILGKLAGCLVRAWPNIQNLLVLSPSFASIQDDFSEKHFMLCSWENASMNNRCLSDSKEWRQWNLFFARKGHSTSTLKN